MEDYQRQFKAFSKQCLSHEVEDQLVASEIRFSRKQLQEDYEILVKAFKFLQDTQVLLLKDLFGTDEKKVSTFLKKRLHCFSKVLEDQSAPAAKYTREDLEEDYSLLMNGLEQVQEEQAHYYKELLMSRSEKEKALADFKECCDEYHIVPAGDVRGLLMASEIKVTLQKLNEDHTTLIKSVKDLEEKCAYFMQPRGENEVLTDSEKKGCLKYQIGLLTKEQSYESVVSKIKFARHLQEEYDSMITVFKDLQARQMCLVEQLKQEALEKQHHTEFGLSNEKNYESTVFKIKSISKHLLTEYDSLIDAFKQLDTKACLLDQHAFVHIRQERNLAGSKKTRNEYERGLSGKEYYKCVVRVNVARDLLEKDHDILIKAFKDFQAKLTSLSDQQAIRQMQHKENPAGPRRQHRAEYETGLFIVVKDRLLQTVNPDLEKTIELLINTRKNLQVEAESWLEKLCSTNEVALTDSRMQGCSDYQRDMFCSRKVQLPHDVHAEIEGIIEGLITARKNIQEEETRLLEELSSIQRVEEEVQTGSKKQCLTNEGTDLLSAVNPELERTIKLLINTRKNVETEVTHLLHELSSM